MLMSSIDGAAAGRREESQMLLYRVNRAQLELGALDASNLEHQLHSADIVPPCEHHIAAVLGAQLLGLCDHAEMKTQFIIHA